MSEICYEPSQIFQPSRARATPSWLGPPIRLLRPCPVFDALGVGREALRLGVGWLWCGGLHGSRCRRCRACCGFGPWQSGDAPVDYVDEWDLSDPADPLNIGMGWGTGGHGLGL